ncbi:MAG: DHA2 family efflux MFS transporter permease subunit [Acidimicrobiia bacterium]|nr:DHA2 family efflux MFS transporter permease subunit [Acidimicrobiia bacterium]
MQAPAPTAERVAGHPPHPPPETVRGGSALASPWAVLAVASMAVFVVFLDTQVLFVAFADLRASFPAVSSADLSWVLSAYTIVLAAALIPAGRVADRIGRRRVFLAAFALFGLASLLCGIAPGPPSLIAARVLQAVGAAGVTPASLSLVLGAFPRSKVPVAVAVWGSVGALAAAAGPTLGALLVEHWGWRSVFFLNLPICAVVLAFGRRLLAESREAEAGRIPDLVGAVLLVAGVGLVALGVVQSEEWGWGTGPTLGALAVGVVVLGAFVARSAAVPNPLVELSLFRVREFRAAVVATAAFTLAFTAMFFANVQFLTQVWGYSIVGAGLAFVPGPVVVMVLAPVFGRLAARVGQRRLLVPGGLVYAASGLWLVAFVDEAPDFFVAWLPGSLLAGLGVALVLPQLTSAAAQSLPPDRFATGSAVVQAVRQLGATFGVALVVVFLAGATPETALDHFQRPWWLLVGAGVTTSLLSLAVRPAARA